MFFQAALLNFLVTLESSQSVGRLVIASIALNLRACMYHSDTSDNITFLWHIRPASLHESHRYDNLEVAWLNSQLRIESITFEFRSLFFSLLEKFSNLRFFNQNISFTVDGIRQVFGAEQCVRGLVSLFCYFHIFKKKVATADVGVGAGRLRFWCGGGGGL